VAAPPLDPDTLAWLRSQVGEEPPDAELAEIVDREYGAGSPDPVKSAAQWVLRKRLADFVAQPATLSVAGEVSRSTGPNIAALRDQLGALDTVEAPALQPLVLTPLAARWGR
jgi:hypothetical protein